MQKGMTESAGEFRKGFIQLLETVWIIDDVHEALPGAKAFCDGLKEKGYHLYLLLSNADFTIYDYFPDFVPFSYFDGKLVSADVHIVKPDVRIYQLLMETYGLNPEECLFVDDRMDNVEGAKKAGMQGVQFLGDYKKVENFLKEAE